MPEKRKVILPEVMLIIVAAIVPIIVRAAVIATPPEFLPLHQDEFRVDVFSFHKAWVLSVCAAVVLLHALSDLIISTHEAGFIKQKISLLVKDPIIVIPAVYVFFVLVSNIASPYTHTALWGIYDRREGLFVQLAYITVFFAAIYHVKNGKLITVNRLLAALMFSSLIMGAVGFSQFINRDFFTTQFAGWLVTGAWQNIEPQFDFSYGTNFNPNTFGLVTAMLFPVMFAAAVHTNCIYRRAGFILAGFLMLTGVVGSRSVGGFIGASAAVAVIITVLTVRFFLHRFNIGSILNRRVYAVFAITLAAAAVTGFALRGFIHENLSFTMGRIAAIFEPPDMSHVTDFNFDVNSLTITERGISYTIDFPFIAGAPEITTHGATVPPSESRELHGETYVNTYIYYIPGMGSITIMRYENIYLYRHIRFVSEDGKLYMLHRDNSLVDPMEPIPSFGFEGWETWGSARGHIFSRTIPLLPSRLILGSGSDTFMLVFPTHDIIGSARYHGNPNILVDKAHNLYLQTAVTTGVISTVALIALFGYFIVTSFFSVIKIQPADGVFWLRLGILASVSAFSVSSLSTDSTVSSTPIFWLIIGIGFGLGKLKETNGRTN